MKELARFELADRLVELAEIYRNNDIPIPYSVATGSDFIFCDAATWHETVRTFGTGTKDADEDSIFFKPERFPWLRINAFKKNVCERVVVGTRDVPEIVVPAIPAVAEHVIPAHVEEIVEWRCKPFTKPEDAPAQQEEQEAPCL